MNTTELASAAGVYDGEGSASTYLPKRRKSRVRQWLSIKAAMTRLLRSYADFKRRLEESA